MNGVSMKLWARLRSWKCKTKCAKYVRNDIDFQLQLNAVARNYNTRQCKDFYLSGVKLI